MKTLLFPTDFSAHAMHAVEYGYRLARQIKAKVILCNAVIAPAEVPQAGMVVWPVEDSEFLLKGSTDELKQLKEHLEHDNIKGDFVPSVTCVNELGTVVDVVNNVIAKEKVDLVIMGTHGSNGLSTFLLGNHSKDMIDAITKPLMLIPPTAPNKPIKKIAFATDFKHPEEDLQYIYQLIPLAKLLNAEILLTHVYTKEEEHSPEFKQWIKLFLVEISNQANYPHIYHRFLKNEQAESGLEWLCEHGQVDMLSMIHRPHGFFHNLIKGSHTKKIAEHISIPLLVFPAKAKS